MCYFSGLSQLLHRFPKYALGFALILLAVVPFSLAQHATTWCTCRFVHLGPMAFGQLEPVRMFHQLTVNHSHLAVKWCVINHTLLKYAEALLLSPKFCSFFRHLYQLLVSGERTLLCSFWTYSYPWNIEFYIFAINKSVVISIFENANHFFPKSFSDAFRNRSQFVTSSTLQK